MCIESAYYILLYIYMIARQNYAFLQRSSTQWHDIRLCYVLQDVLARTTTSRRSFFTSGLEKHYHVLKSFLLLLHVARSLKHFGIHTICIKLVLFCRYQKILFQTS